MFRLLPIVFLAIVCTACAAGLSVEYKADGHILFVDPIEAKS